MIPTAEEMTSAAEWAAPFTRGDAAPVPFSFDYGAMPAAASLRYWPVVCRTEAAGSGVTRYSIVRTDPGSGLEVRTEALLYERFPAVEWVLYLRNTAPADTPILERLLPLDTTVPLGPSAACTVRWSKGALCSPEDFEPVERVLRPRGELCQQPGGGRSSSEVLPFWNVILDGRGLMLAVGWTGEWAVRFARPPEGGLRLQAGMACTRFRLHPGEEVRTPRLLVLFWAGDPIRGHNLLRRFLLTHHRPCPNGKPLIAPLCNGNWGGTPAAVHLDNIRQIVEQDLPFEYYWIDAEWFGEPGHWMKNAGHWTPRPDLYPEGLAPLSEALHRAGRKLLLWFEPERVAPGTPWAAELEPWLLALPPEKAVTWADYGDYLPPEQWTRMESARNQLNPGDRLLNLGHPDARRFLTDFLSDCVRRFGVDCLRWDSNIAQLEYWRHADPPDRQGITEMHYVDGQYRLWDDLLQRHPGLIIDTCASGGRRIDLETISRATPLWRTDYAVVNRDLTAAQCHTFGLLHWAPLNGTGGGSLKDWDEYTLHSTMGASLVAGLWSGGDAPQDRIPADFPFEHARRLLDQYLALRPFFYGDFYPLTEYSRAQDAWMAYQLHMPEADEGILVVLKRPRSPFTNAIFQLRGLDPETEYAFRFLDGTPLGAASGQAAMAEGIEIELPGRPGSAVILYQAS